MLEQPAHIKKLIINHNRRLQILEEQKALYGLDIPPKILIEIEETEARIAALETKLQALPQVVEAESELPEDFRGFANELAGSSQGINAVIINSTSDQIAVGTGNVQNKITGLIQSDKTEPDPEALRRVLVNLKRECAANIPPEKMSEVLKWLGELEEAITDQEPDLDTIGYVRRWFIKHIPDSAEAINNVLNHPTVYKFVAAAGDSLALEFRRRFG
jgi:hypothetical protein